MGWALGVYISDQLFDSTSDRRQPSQRHACCVGVPRPTDVRVLLGDTAVNPFLFFVSHAKRDAISCGVQHGLVLVQRCAVRRTLHAGGTFGRLCGGACCTCGPNAAFRQLIAARACGTS